MVKIGGLRFSVSDGVFHPGFFFSSKILKSELLRHPISGKTVLDIGSGSGFISVFAAHHEALVTAIDISRAAVGCTLKNAEINQVQLKVIQSDLWDQLPPETYDYIVINPPYYPQNPEKESQHAWYCGENFEYFNTLFKDIGSYIHQESKVMMVLSEDCQIEQIKQIANTFDLQFALTATEKNFWEVNYIFEINPEGEKGDL
ncbi:MAG: class I SAM-dependent methyltransferase [Roseivirga sp.]|nr:class I SAM-dependent methyltransferase [Roseivirga sp.]